MATFVSDQLTATRARTMAYPIEALVKMRQAYFSYTATGASTTPNDIDLLELPSGRVRVFPAQSLVHSDAWGASRVLDIGHKAYVGEQNAAVAADDDAFTTSQIDISAASQNTWDATLLKYDMFSMKGITVNATVSGGDQAANDTISGVCVFGTE